MFKMKPWWVWDRFGNFLGTVWAERKGLAQFLAEHDLKAQPGQYHVGRAS